MVAATAQVGSSPLSAIVSAMTSFLQDPPASTVATAGQADSYDAQYSPQVYAVVANSDSAPIMVLESPPYTLNVAFPPLIGTPPEIVPGLPPATTIPESTIIAGTERAVASGGHAVPTTVSHARR